LSNSQEFSDALSQARFQRLKSKRVSEALSSLTSLKRFLATPPLSSFKKVIISTLQLVHALRMMSMAKAVPEGIKDWECKRFVL
jgi:hypothetical protein